MVKGGVSKQKHITYLSLVILCVEEVCVLGQVYHFSDIVLGLVDDGQVEQPAQTEGEDRKDVTKHICNPTTSRSQMEKFYQETSETFEISTSK